MKFFIQLTQLSSISSILEHYAGDNEHMSPSITDSILSWLDKSNYLIRLDFNARKRTDVSRCGINLFPISAARYLAQPACNRQ